MQQFISFSRRYNSALNLLAENLQANLFKLAVLVGMAYLIWRDHPRTPLPDDPAATTKMALAAAEQPAAQPKIETKSQGKKLIGVTLPKGTINNLTFAIDPEYASKYQVSAEDVEKSRAAVTAYIERFEKVAIAEMEKFGIPASITLAQGLLESNAGCSQLVRHTNNHFGMKCFSQKCRKGHCANFSDDSHKDFFRKYDNAWQSFRAHSEFLANTNRYAALFKLKKTDYAAWANGLATAGYATDKRYAEKLIAIIHNLNLAQYDKSSSKKQVP